MTIYVIIATGSKLRDCVEGVFDTLEQAEKQVKRYQECDNEQYWIKEFELNQEYNC